MQNPSVYLCLEFMQNNTGHTYGDYTSACNNLDMNNLTSTIGRQKCQRKYLEITK